jgi:hypothetical protein
MKFALGYAEMIRAALSHELQSRIGTEAIDLGQVHAKNRVQRLTRGEAQGIGLLRSVPGRGKRRR